MNRDESECHIMQESCTQDTIRKIRRIYLAFFIMGLVGIPLIIAPFNTAEIGGSITAICGSTCLGFLAVALRYGLNYSWGKTVLIIFLLAVFSLIFLVGVFSLILYVGVVLVFLILFAIFDRKVYLASRSSNIPPSALRLANSTKGASYTLLLIAIGVFLLLPVFISAIISRFQSMFSAFGTDLPYVTLFLLNTPLWFYQCVLSVLCFTLVLKEFTSSNTRMKMCANLGVGLLVLGWGLFYCFVMFGTLVKGISQLGS
jgi:hypothetical protein